MTMKRHAPILLLIGFFLATTSANAVITRTYTFKIKIPDIKMMRIITPGVTGTIHLELNAFQAGAPVDPTGTAINSNSWLQLTSIAPLNETRKVVVQVTDGTNVPLGTLLYLSATGCTTGDGARGTAYQNLELSSSTAKTLIDGIGSCYTGIGNTDGYNLTYLWMPDPENIDKLVAFSSYQIYVTYTFTSY